MPLTISDNCYTSTAPHGNYDWRTEGPVATISSAWSGIQLDIYTDQDAFQVYSCNGQNGTIPSRRRQGLTDNTDFPRTVPKYGCIVLEVAGLHRRHQPPRVAPRAKHLPPRR